MKQSLHKQSQHLLSANTAHLLSVQYILRWIQSMASPSGESKPSETRTPLDPPFKSTRSIVFWLVLAKYTFKMYTRNVWRNALHAWYKNVQAVKHGICCVMQALKKAITKEEKRKACFSLNIAEPYSPLNYSLHPVGVTRYLHENLNLVHQRLLEAWGQCSSYSVTMLKNLKQNKDKGGFHLTLFWTGS